MTPDSVAWGVAFALVGFGALRWLGAAVEAPRPDCRAPVLLEDRGAWAVVGCGVGHGPPVDGAAGLLFGIPLDLNQASALDLQALPGVGPVRADAIVAARRVAPFCAVSAIERVAGIGPRTAAGLAGWVRADCRPAEPPALGATRPALR